MNNKYLIAGLVALGVLIGFGVGHMFVSGIAGDFPGGVVPSQVMTGSTAVGTNGAAYPAGTLGLGAPNGLYVGVMNQYHQVSTYNTASGTPSAVVTLGAFGTTTSSATTSITLGDTSGLQIGAICSGSSNTTTVYISGCLLSSTTGVTGTAVVAYSNITVAALAVPTTTVFRVSFDQLPY